MSDLKRVSPAEAKQLMEEAGYTYLDVRTPAEFAAGRPAGAVLVPWANAGPTGMVPNEGFLDEIAKTFPKDAKLVIGCKTGGRSQKAALALIAAGYENVVDQRAGFEGARNAFGQVSEKGWAAEGYPVDKG